MSSYPILRPLPQCQLLAVAKSFTAAKNLNALYVEGDLTCGISPIGLAVSDNEVEIEYGSAVFSSGLRTGYDEIVLYPGTQCINPRGGPSWYVS